MPRSSGFTRLVAVLALALALLAPAALHAQARPYRTAFGPAEPPESPDDDTVWYGWQNLSVDLAAVGVLVAGFLREDQGRTNLFLAGSLVVYAVGSPAVHYANGQRSRAATSLGLRVGIPLVVGLISYGALVDCDDHHNKVDCEYEGMLGVIGMGLLSTIVVMGVDDFGLSYKAVAKPARTWSPSVAPTQGGLTLGLAGTF